MTDITTPQTFEEKMKVRIKESIGDLLSDEDLSKLVAKGIDNAFFDERTAKTGCTTQRKFHPLCKRF